MILSVDGGATKTFATLFNDRTGEIGGIGISGPSNYFSVPVPVASNNINDAIKKALGSGKIENLDVIFGIAGYGDSQTADSIGTEMVNGIMKGKDFRLENDGTFAYRMANLFSDGAIFAPGTGSIGIYQENGILKRIGGWGWFAGDDGSASWIAKRAITLAENQYDGIADGSSLIKLVEEYYRNTFKEAINQLESNHPKREVAMMAPLVSELARQGDGSAMSILMEAGTYDAAALNSMLNRFKNPVKASIVGGTVRAGNILLDVVRKNVGQRVSSYYGYDVCIGGIAILYKELGYNFTEKLRDSMIKDIDGMLEDQDPETLKNYLGIYK